MRGQVLLSPGIDGIDLRARPWKLFGFRIFEREDTAPPGVLVTDFAKG